MTKPSAISSGGCWGVREDRENIAPGAAERDISIRYILYGSRNNDNIRNPSFCNANSERAASKPIGARRTKCIQKIQSTATEADLREIFNLCSRRPVVEYELPIWIEGPEGLNEKSSVKTLSDVNTEVCDRMKKLMKLETVTKAMNDCDPEERTNVLVIARRCLKEDIQHPRSKQHLFPWLNSG
jgi:hypothetical protein